MAEITRRRTGQFLQELLRLLIQNGRSAIQLHPFVCTGGFTKDAEDEARTQEKRKIRLIDLERFVEMWTECYPRLEDAAKQKLPLQPIWFVAPME